MAAPENTATTHTDEIVFDTEGVRASDVFYSFTITNPAPTKARDITHYLKAHPDIKYFIHGFKHSIYDLTVPQEDDPQELRGYFLAKKFFLVTKLHPVIPLVTISSASLCLYDRIKFRTEFNQVTEDGLVCGVMLFIAARENDCLRCINNYM